jgi:acyl carrier protein
MTIKREVPIGRSIRNLQAYILDKHLQPTPIGIPGELHLGGAGLSRGYLNRPELTAEKFIQHPFSDEPEARLYKTGDLVRYLPDGNIEFLGRVDQQVKVRGFRIELGEIEAVLDQHPTVQEAVVTAREDSPGDKRLVAYIVPATGQTPEVTELRHFLAQQLPNYMVPAVFVILASMPMTPNGKIDRRALPAPEASLVSGPESYVPPRTPIEQELAKMWVDILKVEQVGIHDNFFDLGGHSLSATRLVSRVRDTFQIELPLQSIFEAQTVAELAQTIEQLSNQEKTGQLAPIKRISRNQPELK